MKISNIKSLENGKCRRSPNGEKMGNPQTGFTLIELLVVVAIIGVLSALLMSNFIGIRQRARDGQRKSDLRQIQSALELYRSDIGSYPTSELFISNGYLVCGQTLSLGTTVYMKTIPCDPLSSGSYQFTSSSSVYCIRACLENTNDSQKDATNDNVAGCTFTANVNCSTSSFQSYTLQNP